MARFPISVSTAAATLLGILSADSAWAQPCRDPDPDPLRTPIRDNRTPFNLTVEKVRSASGNIVITLYGDDPKRWLVDEGSLYIYTVPASAPKTTICIVVPGLRKYAIAVYHDRNRNGRIDRKDSGMFKGVPTEDAGLSNNPSTLGMIWPKLPPALINVNRPGMATKIKLRSPPF